jgi:hypothetical protein
MAPVPLEGLQTLVANAAAQGGLGGPQEGNRGRDDIPGQAHRLHNSKKLTTNSQY